VFRFKKHLDAIEFLRRVAEATERLTTFQLLYVNLTLRLTTHDAGNKVTEKQLRLAEEIQKAVEESKGNLAQ